MLMGLVRVPVLCSSLSCFKCPLQHSPVHVLQCRLQLLHFMHEAKPVMHDWWEYLPCPGKVFHRSPFVTLRMPSLYHRERSIMTCEMRAQSTCHTVSGTSVRISPSKCPLLPPATPRPTLLPAAGLLKMISPSRASPELTRWRRPHLMICFFG